MSEEDDRQRLLAGQTDDGGQTRRYGACESQDINQDSPKTVSGAGGQPGLTEPAAPLTRRERRLLGCLALVGLLSGSLLVVMIPFFPVEAAARGLSQTTISAVFSSYALAQTAASPLVGRLAPVVGVTRLYTLGLATAGVTTVVFGALRHIVDPRLFAAACLAVRLVEAAGTAAVSGCALTIIASQFPTRTSRAIALVTASQAVGMAAAPAIGSGLFALGGFSLPFYVTGAALLLVAAVNHWLMPVVERCHRPAVPYLSLWRVFARCPENWLCLLTVFHYSLVLLTFDTSVAPYADRTLGVTPSTLGLYFTVATTAFALTAFVWARVAETSRRPHAFIGLGLLVVSASLLLAPPSPLLVGLQPHWWLLGLGMTLMEAFFGGAYIPSFQLMLAAGVGAGLADDLISQAFVSGVLWTAHSLGSVVGPPLGGLVVDRFGFPVMMTGLSALVLVVAVMNLCYAGWVACRPAPSNPSEANSAGERIQNKA